MELYPNIEFGKPLLINALYASVIRYTVNTNGVNFRSAPGLNSTVIGILYLGESVAHENINSNFATADGMQWAYVQRASNGQWGWVALQYLNR